MALWLAASDVGIGVFRATRRMEPNRGIITNHTTNEVQDLALLEKYKPGIDDGDVAWFIVKDDEVPSNCPGKISQGLIRNIRERFGLGRVVLIAKDGGMELRLERLRLDVLFAAIDAMPVRQYGLQP